jgi:hypothetical protein
MTAVLAQALTSGRQVDVTHPDDSSAVSGVAYRPANTSSQPLQLDALEVTQAVQDLAHSVPLISGKRTVVRAYLSYYGSGPITVTGRLSVRSDPSSAPTTVNSANSVTLQAASAGNVTVTRNDAARSLNFVLPASAIVAGQLAVRLSQVTNTATGAAVAIGSDVRPIVSFQPTAPLRVRVIRFTYQMGTPPITHAPSNLDYNLLISWLRRAYPVAQVVASQATVAATATAPFTRFDINAQLAAIRTADVNAGTDNRTHYYGLVADSGFFMRGGAAGIPTTPDPTVVASGPTGPGTWGWDLDGSYGDWYGGHELGHTLGRLHPGFCGESANDLDNYPFPNGQLSTDDAGFAGFDVGDPGNGIAMAAQPGSQWRDVMTYCNNQWLSPYTYQGIRTRLLAEDTLPASTGSGPGAGGGHAAASGAPAEEYGMYPAGAASGGRPDARYPDKLGAGGEGAAPSATPAEPTPVSVVATVNLTRRTGAIKFVNPVPNLEPSAAAEEGRAVLRVATVDGTPLGEFPAPIQIDSELEPDEDQIGLVDTVVLAAPGAARIDLVVDDEVVDTFQAGGAPPRARALNAVPAGKDELGLALELEEPAEEGQTFTIQVSTDSGRSWQTIGVGLPEPSTLVDRSQFSPGEEVLVRVMATNGFTSSVVTAESFTA